MHFARQKKSFAERRGEIVAQETPVLLEGAGFPSNEPGYGAKFESTQNYSQLGSSRTTLPFSPSFSSTGQAKFAAADEMGIAGTMVCELSGYTRREHLARRTSPNAQISEPTPPACRPQ